MNIGEEKETPVQYPIPVDPAAVPVETPIPTADPIAEPVQVPEHADANVRAAAGFLEEHWHGRFDNMSKVLDGKLPTPGASDDE